MTAIRRCCNKGILQLSPITLVALLAAAGSLCCHIAPHGGFGQVHILGNLTDREALVLDGVDDLELEAWVKSSTTAFHWYFLERGHHPPIGVSGGIGPLQSALLGYISMRGGVSGSGGV